MEDLILDRAIHGKGCALGELYLTEDELHRINSLIAASGFRFIRAATAVAPPSKQQAPQAKPPQAKQTKRTSRVLPKEAPRPAVKVVSPAIKRRANTRRASSAPVDDSSSEVLVDSTHPKKRKKVASTAIPSESRSTTGAAAATAAAPSLPPPLPTLNTTPLIKETPKRPPIIDIKGEGRGAWEAACLAVCDIIESNPLAKYFLQPVNPEADGLPEYFEKVQNPMDLHTVRQKLDGKLYTHPFRWQHDIRSIFFNAFLYFEEGSPIWRNAAELAVTFENLCKENLGVNPYAVYKMEAVSVVQAPPSVAQQPPALPSVPAEAAPVASATMSKVTSTESVEPPAAALLPVTTPVPAAVSTVETPPNLPPIPASREITTGTEMITLDSAQLKALLQQAAEKGITDISPPTSTVGVSPSPPHLATNNPPASSTAPAIPTTTRVTSQTGAASGSVVGTSVKKGRPIPPKGVRFREGFGVVYTAECNGTPFEREVSRNPPVSALPPPCPVPATQVTDTKSPLIPTAAQKKTTLARFKELDVTYRKAVLDLVKNELGINSLLCALDSRYIPEVDVLPHLKQRQFFLFMKALVTQQKLAQDTHHLPATLPRILNWNTAAATESSTPQQTVEPPSKRKIFLDKMAGSSPVDTSPWVVSGATAKNKNKSSSSSSSSSEPESSDGGSESDSSSASSVYRSVPAASPPAPRVVPEKKLAPAPAVVPTRTMMPRPAPSPYAPFMPALQPRPMASGSGKVLPMPGLPYGRPFHPMPFGAFPGGMPPTGLSPGAMPPMPGIPAGMQRMMPAPTQSMPPMGGPPSLMPRLPTPPDVYHRPTPQRPRHQRLGLWRPGIGTGSTNNPSLPPSAWSMPQTAQLAPTQVNGGTCWGEWKTKVLQETFLSQTRNVGVASERESRAEKADAEI